MSLHNWNREVRGTASFRYVWAQGSLSASQLFPESFSDTVSLGWESGHQQSQQYIRPSQQPQQIEHSPFSKVSALGNRECYGLNCIPFQIQMWKS